MEPVAKLHGNEKSKILNHPAEAGKSSPKPIDGGLPKRAGEEMGLQEGLKERFFVPKSFATGSVEYSVEALSKISKISVRTLHYYDQIGLLKPMMRLQNGRRLYGTEQFLRLQEILYFKELGLSLKKIQLILNLKNIDRCSILTLQKSSLKREIERFQKLLLSIDKTMAHYKGVTMSDQDICNQFENFNVDIKEFEELAEIKFGKTYMQDIKENFQKRAPEKIHSYTQGSVAIFNKLVLAIKNQKLASSKEVQDLMQEQADLFNAFSGESPGMGHYTKENYQTSREMIIEGPDFYSRYHPDLARFIYDAMGIFAEEHFK